MNKIIEKIKTHYMGQHGNIKETRKEVKWEHNNPHLLTGQINLLLKYNDFLEYKNNWIFFKEQFFKYSSLCSLGYYHYTRHAPAQEYLDSPYYDSMSLDEHDGLIFSDVAFGYGYMSEILYKGGEFGGWYFNEKDIFGKPYPQNVNQYVNLLWGFVNVLVYAIKNFDFSGSNGMDKVIFKFPSIVKLTRIRLGKERAFIRICANQKPGTISFIHLWISLVYSGVKDKASGHNRTFYRFLVFEYINYNNALMSFAKRFYIKKLKKRYSCKEDEILNKITIRYFWNKDHPIHELTKGVKLNCQ